MYIIAGLGNPGLKYRHTRHNAGFDAIDEIAKKYQIAWNKTEFSAKTGSGMIAGEKVLLVKPQTYMNNSGESIGPICTYYKVNPQTNLIVISDDVTLDVGRIRIRAKGSAGGHNGLKSLIAHCKTQEFKRIRIGVGKLEADQDMIAHVLGKVSKADRPQLEEAFMKSTGAIEYLLQDQLEQAMNQYNK